MYYPNLYSLRMQAQYSQEYVSQVLQIDQSEYSRMESGKREPKANELNALAKLYNTNTEHLLNGAAEQMTHRKSVTHSVPLEIFERAEAQRELLIQALIEKNNYAEGLIKQLVNLVNNNNGPSQGK